MTPASLFHSMRQALTFLACVSTLAGAFGEPQETYGATGVIRLQAKDTLTVLEMNCGERLDFTLQNGEIRRLALEKTSARVVERVEPGGVIYCFECQVNIDGQPMTLRRYVCSQESFYEPYVVNGLRIWPDTVKAVFDLIPVRYPRRGNLQCVPRKDARFAVQDATLRVCPLQTHPWLDEPQDFIGVGRCYNGDDCYLGPYLGRACHVGMDINHPKGSPLFAPIDCDTQGYFNSLKAGHNNNRWRGIRRWPNGDVWALQTHHLIELLVPEDTPLKAGAKYATTAGVHVGSHEHTHFEFKVGRPRDPQRLPAVPDTASIAFPVDFDDESEMAQQQPEVLHVDPWVFFWQVFEDRKSRNRTLHAAMEPLSPCQTGEPVQFRVREPRGSGNTAPEHFWTFGDGGCSTGAEPQHTFAQPGVYPVTLVADDGARRAACTQHVTVNGNPVATPVLRLSAPDEISFRRRPPSVVDVYSRPPRRIPNTLEFLVRAAQPEPRTKTVRIENAGRGALPKVSRVSIQDSRDDWLSVTTRGSGNEQRLDVTVDATRLKPGRYSAIVGVFCPKTINSPQRFRVALRVAVGPTASELTVDDGDPGCYATPYFWVGHRFCRCALAKQGHEGFYLTNGKRAVPGEFVRFTPDLCRGRYEVSLSEKTPFPPDAEFNVRLRHRSGISVTRIHPATSRVMGAFNFDEGMDGYVEILAEGSKGLVIADAVHFRRISKHTTASADPTDGGSRGGQ